MWELIRANKRNSVILMALMGVVMLSLGFCIGYFIFGQNGMLLGILISIVIWAIMMLVSFTSGDQVFLACSGAKKIDHAQHPQLFNVVEEMAISASIPMPKVYIINDPAPNAFATGRSPKSASVAVTAGLLAKLNRDQLQGVIAHEISHILNRDILFITMAGVMLGSITLISQVFLRGMFYSSMTGSRRRCSSRSTSGGGQAQLILMIIAIIAAILAPIMAQILYFAVSRKREYLADASAVRLTRYPQGLAEALEKISSDSGPQLSSANKITAPMYIANPMKKKNGMSLSNLSSTHPPISERIKILRSMHSGSSLKDYNTSYQKATSKTAVIPNSGLETIATPIRSPGVDSIKNKTTKQQVHQINDIMRIVNGFAFLTCSCGLKMKIPPNYKNSSVICPKCKIKHNIKK